MADNNLPTIVRPARKGSKAGWVNVVGKIPPELRTKFDEYLIAKGVFETDAVHEAVKLLLSEKAA